MRKLVPFSFKKLFSNVSGSQIHLCLENGYYRTHLIHHNWKNNFNITEARASFTQLLKFACMKKEARSLFSAKYLGFDTLSFSYPKEETWLFRKQIINVWIDLQHMHKICSNRIHTWRELIISFSLLDKNIWFRQVLLTCYLQSEITLYTEKRKPQTHGKHLPNK